MSPVLTPLRESLNIRVISVISAKVFLNLAILLLALYPCSLAAQTARPSDSARLAQIADEFWQYALRTHLYQSAIAGEQLTELPNISVETENAEAAFARHIADELKSVKPEALSHEDWLTYKILSWEMWRISNEAKYYWLFFQITPYTSPLPQAEGVLAAQPLRNEADLQHYLTLLDQYAEFVNRIDRELHEQARRGIVLPKPELPIAENFLASMLHSAAESPLLPDSARLASIAPQQAAEFRNNAAAIISGKIHPALQQLVDYVRGPYAAKAPQAVVVGQYPGGKEFYRYITRVSTTLNVTPEEVHRIGLEEVENTEKQMAAVRRAIGFKGTRREFHQYLKTDPRFFPKSPQDIESRLLFYAHRVEPLLPKYFSRMPRAPYAIKRLPAGLEGGMTFGHYALPSATEKRGIYYYNGSHLDQRSLLPIGALVLHELLPGHHFQLNLQAENHALPPFRRVPVHPAYTEGWANYCSEFGREMTGDKTGTSGDASLGDQSDVQALGDQFDAQQLGVYEDLYDVYGMLMTDMRQSVRLVVDTGMNAMRWNRERAMQFMREHGVDSETQIASESLRYSVDSPGQALAYKMGSREIWKLRAQYQKQLGPQFDLRHFHDCFLDSGSMPLDILEQHMKWCMGKQRTS